MINSLTFQRLVSPCELVDYAVPCHPIGTWVTWKLEDSRLWCGRVVGYDLAHHGVSQNPTSASQSRFLLSHRVAFVPTTAPASHTSARPYVEGFNDATRDFFFPPDLYRLPHRYPSLIFPYDVRLSVVLDAPVALASPFARLSLKRKALVPIPASHSNRDPTINS